MSPCHPRRLRKFSLGLLLSIFLSFAFGSIGQVYAQNNGNVNLTARVGFDGYCKEEKWLPVHVTVENTGQDLKASVEVSYKKSTGGKSVTSQDIELPSTSRKEFFLYTYLTGFTRDLDVSLLSKGKVLKSATLPLACLSGENMIFGVVADRASSYDVLNDVKPLNGSVRVAQLKLADLPDRAQAW